ncbi:FAD dependent oxidoreductase [Mycolicibacterium rhodesiae JS60]|nr:FAD dependent oxidoreductase [Mycolicibacterium rhodesiae JS60]
MHNDADVVVVGAGIAGLCCAASLLELGLRPVLVCETPEVGWSLRAVKVGNSRGFVQHPVWQPTLNGGSWYSAARYLGAPVNFDVSPPLQIHRMADKSTVTLSVSTSSAAIVDTFAKISPVPIEDQRDGLEKLMGQVQKMSWTEISALSEVPLSAWLQDRGADMAVSKIMCGLAAKISEIPLEVAEQILNAYGILTKIRTLLFGEAFCTSPAPDPWEGMVLPIARALEAAGCTILRGDKMTDLLLDRDRAVGVALASGREVRAPAVALATATPRVARLLGDRMPDRVRAAVDHANSVKGFDCCTYSLLDTDVTRGLGNITMVSDETGANRGYVFPMHAVSPGSTEPGRFLLAAQSQHMPEEYDAIGGHDGAVQYLLALQEQLFPGLESATIELATQVHPYGWLNPSTHGPKLPGRCAEIPGLYFAGDGSTPTMSFGIEGAGQAGRLRAHAIASDLTSQGLSQ